ncbi:MAG: hypothetical protein V1722_02160 [Candidatus Micrarchaeota archaeon]
MRWFSLLFAFVFLASTLVAAGNYGVRYYDKGVYGVGSPPAFDYSGSPAATAAASAAANALIASGGITWTNTTVLTTNAASVAALESSSGYSASIASSQRIEFTVGEETHHVGVISVNATMATILIQSTPLSVTLAIGESAQFDLNDDSTDDLYVKLLGINNSIANLVIKKINLEAAAPESEEVESDNATAGTVGGTESTGESKADELPWLPIVGVIVILVVLYFVFVKSKR